MFDLPAAMLSVLSIFLPLFFSKPSFMNFLELFQGHILCKGKRTVSEILKTLGLRNVKNYSRYHDFFRKAKWSTLKGAEILLLYIVSLIPPRARPLRLDQRPHLLAGEADRDAADVEVASDPDVPAH